MKDDRTVGFVIYGPKLLCVPCRRTIGLPSTSFRASAPCGRERALTRRGGFGKLQPNWCMRGSDP